MSSFMICAVRDIAVGAFMNPFVVRSRAEAIRGFSDAVNDPKMEFHKHPEDYQLFCVGEWDDHAGLTRELTKNELLISASDCIAVEVKPSTVDLSNPTLTVNELFKPQPIPTDADIERYLRSRNGAARS